MNVLLINTQDQGGAARAVHSLHQNLRSYGHNSKLLIKRKTVSKEDIVQCPPPSLLKRVWNRARTALTFRNPEPDPEYCFFNALERRNYISTELLLKQVPFKPDLIIVNWISQFINARNLYELNRITGAPVLWYLMDMAPLTGGCHYAWDCHGYINRCGSCPALYSTNAKDIAYQNFKEKLHYIRQTDLVVVLASHWIAQKVEQSALFVGKRKEHIMIGIDSDVFSTSDKSIGRTVFNLPMDRKIILLDASSIRQARKGVEHMVEALGILAASLTDSMKGKVFLVIAGQDDNNTFKDVCFPHKSIGFLSDDRLLALAYQSADIFVCPSIEDSGPMMINEAIMCGTPVVAFNMGVAPDLVYNGKTGYRAKLKDSEDLAKGIAGILNLNNDEYTEMSRNCRQLGLELCSPKVQVEGFERLFDDISNRALH